MAVVEGSSLNSFQLVFMILFTGGLLVDRVGILCIWVLMMSFWVFEICEQFLAFILGQKSVFFCFCCTCIIIWDFCEVDNF